MKRKRYYVKGDNCELWSIHDRWLSGARIAKCICGRTEARIMCRALNADNERGKK